MNDLPEENLSNLPSAADRPLECTECHKPIAVLYTEIVDQTFTHTSMCADCPVLQRRLHGMALDHVSEGQGEGKTGLVCGTCGTTLHAVRVGAPLGCDACYDVFGDVILSELINANKLPARAVSKKTAPIHIGRLPGETQEMNRSLRLSALNQALNETLQREDYEQAAWLRDQIKELTEKGDKEKNGT